MFSYITFDRMQCGHFDTSDKPNGHTGRVPSYTGHWTQLTVGQLTVAS